MTTSVEQHICIKFCQKLGHWCSETYDMIQQAFGNDTMGHTQVESGLGGSKRDGCQSRVTKIHGDPPQQEPNDD